MTQCQKPRMSIKEIKPTLCSLIQLSVCLKLFKSSKLELEFTTLLSESNILTVNRIQ